MHRYLVGPIIGEEAWRYWQPARERGECRVFNQRHNLDLSISNDSSWDDVVRQLPPEWRPDFIALCLDFTTIPSALWQAPVPVVGLVRDADVQWHALRRLADHCDLLLADQPTVAALRRAGVAHVCAVNLCGLPQSWLGLPLDGPVRDIDVLFIGTASPSQRWQRLRWLDRLAALGQRHKVVLRSRIPDAEYLDLMRRARIVFNHTTHGGCNRRAFEAAAAEALLFQEAGNQCVGQFLAGGTEHVAYGEQDLEELLEHYLAHEDQRRAIAAAGQRAVQACSFDALWQQALATLGSLGPQVQKRCRQREDRDNRPSLLTRVWSGLRAQDDGDSRLMEDVAKLADEQPGAAAPHYLLGHALALDRRQSEKLSLATAWEAARHFQHALQLDPTHVLAAFNLVEVLATDPEGHGQAAIKGATQVLAMLDKGVGCTREALEAPPFVGESGLLTLEWDCAGLDNAGSPDNEVAAKGRLLRWRLHTLLGRLHPGDPTHHGRALEQRPDLPTTQAAYGAALLRARRAKEGIHHLLLELHTNPFDTEAARILFRALCDVGQRDAADRLASTRLLLCSIAPDRMQPEPWFAGPNGAPAFRQVKKVVTTISLEEFRRRFGLVDTRRALSGFTPALDTNLVLTLLAHSRAKNVLEIGTAAGHMTANLTEWSDDDARIFTVGIVADLHQAPGPQAPEVPSRAAFGASAGHFGKADKVLFVTADSFGYDFSRFGELDFVFIDGAHDLEHVLSDTRQAYQALREGGCLVWHDVESPVPWVQVDQALAQAGLPETIWHIASSGVAFLHKQPAAAPAKLPAPAVVWEGAQAGLHSLALVNRHLCDRLVAEGVELSLLVRELPPEAGVAEVPLPPHLSARVNQRLSRPADVHVRHAWPPDFRPPDQGHFVLMQPWEFGSLPRDWVRPIIEQVDEVWTYSRHVRETFIQSGVAADRVRVVPLGVDVTRFCPDAPKHLLRTSKRYRFLFVGGTIHRKGFDILLDAYGRAFTAADDVCLVVKDMGANTFYQGQTAEELIHRFRERPDSPAVEHITDDLSEEEMAGLYTACDCLVQPYRGEGFGLPIAEAMACGLPVMVTGCGAALDFCADDRAYLVPARIVQLAEKRIGQWETVDHPWLAEPDVAALMELLRDIIADPESARAKGRAACAWVRQHLTWEHAARVVRSRVEDLRRKPICRRHAITPATKGRMRVSLCLIVKNEESNIAACLHSAEGLCDEVIVVDTGSTDRTKEIASELGAKVYDFAWVDSFSAARNECLKHATGDWIFWLDADDRIDDDNRRKLKDLFSSLPDANLCYSMKCRCLPDPNTGVFTDVDHIRLFRRHPAIRWAFRVHEQILPSVRAAGGDVRWADVVILHTGYTDPALRRRKLERDLRLLRLEESEQPDNPFTMFNLGSVTQELGRPEEALPYLRRSLAGSHPNDSIVRKLYALIVGCHRALKQPNEAVAACAEGLQVCPGDTELLYLDAVLRRDQRDMARAEASLLRLLHERPGEHFASVDPGMRGYKARHLLGVVYFEQGRLGEARTQWQAALAERGDFLPAWLGLGECALRGCGSVEEVARALGGLPNGKAEAEGLRARAGAQA
jgi:glycosyltransferase involved in cell wall biosynthesis/tetratricopeptide (TPR) repeat protein